MTLILAVVKKVTVFWKHQTEVCLAIGLLETKCLSMPSKKVVK